MAQLTYSRQHRFTKQPAVLYVLDCHHSETWQLKVQRLSSAIFHGPTVQGLLGELHHGGLSSERDVDRYFSMIPEAEARHLFRVRRRRTQHDEDDDDYHPKP